MARSAVPGGTGAEGFVASAAPRMGYQPALDGLRALSVLLVICYHAGVVRNASLPAGMPRSWFFDGGFLGVEVFFVVSGYLITTLLVEERARTGTISLRAFWVRRFRRLIPALWAMVVVVSVWAMVWGRGYLDDLRQDVPFALTYTSNFQQLFRKVSYFEGLPHLLRHLWSLAVEEHFYLLFPPIAVWVLRRKWHSPRRLLRVVVPAALASVVALAVVWQRPVERLTDSGAQLDDLRQNWSYLSTFTRAGGILIGVALALVWSPWARKSVTASGARAIGADVLGVLSIGGVVAFALTLSNESAVLYRGGLTAVSLLSAVAIATAVHPRARVMHALFGNRVMAALGRRSYGLYLWHWPIFVGPLEGRSIAVRMVVGLPATVVVSEICYRLIETPLRKGGLLVWLRRRPAAVGVPFLVAATALTVGLVAVRAGDPGEFGDDTAAAEQWVEANDDTSVDDTAVSVDSVAGSTLPSTTEVPAVDPDTGDTAAPVTAAPRTTTTVAALPRRVVAVGDSTAGALARNVPKAYAQTIRWTDGALSGCSVNENGVAFGKFKTGRDFRVCKGWQGRWSGRAKRAAAEVALIVIGAWDVFNIDYGRGHKVMFGTAEFDGAFVRKLRTGIDALLETGAKVAILEVPCYRPHFTGGPGTFEFPERGDDAITGHVNDLLRGVADSDPGNVTFVTGPTAWCHDEKIASNWSYRYDGVHYTRKGAAFVYEAIKDQLLAIPVSANQHAKKPKG